MREAPFSLDYYPEFGCLCVQTGITDERERVLFGCVSALSCDSDPFRVAKPISAQLYRENTGTGNCNYMKIIKEQESIERRD